MKRVAAIAVGLALVVGAFSPRASAQGGAWTTLFDAKSKNLDSFNRVGDANWTIADGAVQADKGMGGYLVTKQPYGDFEIKAEFWVDTPANSGIFIRCANAQMPSGNDCYEVNIYDTRPDPAYATGAIVNVGKVTTPIKAANKWNTYEIRAQGPHMVVTLNGVKTVDVEDAKHARGPFALQYGTGVVKFRLVQVRAL